jgi:hypothetical protein
MKTQRKRGGKNTRKTEKTNQERKQVSQINGKGARQKFMKFITTNFSIFLTPKNPSYHPKIIE